jgi:N-acyl-D-aspartate/D-glutamate deacylase
MKADIAVVDLDNFKPVADFDSPTELAAGVRELLVNGAPAIADGQYNGALSGEIIHRQELECPR